MVGMQLLAPRPLDRAAIRPLLRRGSGRLIEALIADKGLLQRPRYRVAMVGRTCAQLITTQLASGPCLPDRPPPSVGISVAAKT